MIPNKLQLGDKIALISPSFKITKQELQFAKERILALGLEPVITDSTLDQNGCYAGTIESRAQEINNAISDPNIKAIIAIRGGAGASQLLDHINYQNITNNPKILLGYSDITALLISIYNKTGLVTFHGPMPTKVMPSFTVNYLKQILLDGKLVLFKNEKNTRDDLIQTENRITTINSGTTEGILIGGNLTVLTNLIGSDYLPQQTKFWQNKILFVEDVNEDIHKIDRALSQLQNAKILDHIKGFIFGLSINCNTGYMGSVSLEETLQQYFKNRKIPVFSGAMIGHSSKIFTLPIGIKVTIDANHGTIKMLEKAVE